MRKGGKDFSIPDEIIGKTTRIFYELGYDKASISDIAQAMDMSKAGLYYYFKNKNELLFMVVSRYVDELLDQLETNLSKIEDPKGKLEFLILRHIKITVENYHSAKVIFHDLKCLEDYYLSIIKEKERKYVAIVKDILEEIKAKGKAKDVEPIAATFGLFGICNWIYHWYDPKGRITPEELAKDMAEIFLFGFMTDSKERGVG